MENILEAIEQGIFTPKTKDRLLELENRQTELEDRMIVREKLKKPEFTADHIAYWLTKFRQGDIQDFEFKRAVINALVNSVFVLKKPEFTADHIAYWLTKFRQGDIQDFEFKRAVINALVNSVFVYDDDTDPNSKKGRIIIALNLKNGRQGDIQDFEFKRAVINALVNSVFVYDDDTDPNSKKGRIIIALNLKNGSVSSLARSDVQQMGHHFKRNSNFCRIQRYTAVFFIASRNAGISIVGHHFKRNSNFCRIQRYTAVFFIASRNAGISIDLGEI